MSLVIIGWLAGWTVVSVFSDDSWLELGLKLFNVVIKQCCNVNHNDRCCNINNMSITLTNTVTSITTNPVISISASLLEHNCVFRFTQIQPFPRDSVVKYKISTDFCYCTMEFSLSHTEKPITVLEYNRGSRAKQQTESVDYF